MYKEVNIYWLLHNHVNPAKAWRKGDSSMLFAYLSLTLMDDTVPREIRKLWRERRLSWLFCPEIGNRSWGKQIFLECRSYSSPSYEEYFLRLEEKASYTSSIGQEKHILRDFQKLSLGFYHHILPFVLVHNNQALLQTYLRIDKGLLVSL